MTIWKWSVTMKEDGGQADRNELAEALMDDDFPLAMQMIAAGADVNARDEFGRTLLMLVAACCPEDCLPGMTAALLAAGAELEARDGEGRTALHHASAWAVETLVRAGADLEARDNRGWTALHQAAKDDVSATLRELLAAGADSRALDGEGNTPLHVAASFDSSDALEALVEMGADPLPRNGGGLTALDMMYRNDADELGYFTAARVLAPAMVKAGAQRGEDGGCLEQAVEDYLMIRNRGGHGGDERVIRFHMAVWTGHTELLEEFSGLSVNSRLEGWFPPLHIAVRNGDVAMAEALLASGADADAVDAEEASCRSVAVERDDLPMTELLVRYGADPGKCGGSGESPLQAVERKGNTGMVTLLKGTGR